MSFKIRISNLKFVIFKYLWILILAPKSVQFILLAILAFLFCTKKIELDKVSICFIGMALIQILAIIVQVLSVQVDVERLLAAINTSLIWIVALLLYSFYRQTKIDDIDITKIARYTFINILILIFIYVFYLFADKNVYNLFGYNFVLKRMDYLASGTTTRFCGGMETVLCPSHLFCILSPIIVLLSGVIKSKRLPLIMISGMFISVIGTHSRIGTLVCGFIFIIYITYCVTNSVVFQKYKKPILFILFFLVVLFCLLNSNSIISMLNKMLNSRVGSNNARFSIYENSIKKTISESPIIGIGIKYMLGDFPYGSHCTYIGIFYKTGLFGTLLFVIGIAMMCINIWNNISNKETGRLAYIMILSYFGLLIFSDIDASNWVLSLAFICYGLLNNRNFTSICLEK